MGDIITVDGIHLLGVLTNLYAIGFEKGAPEQEYLDSVSCLFNAILGYISQ